MPVKVAAPTSLAFGPPRLDSGYRPVPIRQVPSATIQSGAETRPGSLDFAKAVLRHLAGDSRFTDTEDPYVVDTPSAGHMGVLDRVLNVATLGEHEHPGGLKAEGETLAQSFNPLTSEGVLNWAGLLGGHRLSPGARGQGSGHAEKEFPSSVKGFTLKRMKGVTPVPHKLASHESGPYRRPTQWYGWQGDRQNFYKEPRQIGRQNTTGDSVPIQFGYNIVKDATKEVVGSFTFDLYGPGPDGKRLLYGNEAYIKPAYQHMMFAKDLLKIIYGAGVPFEAAIANQGTLGPYFGRMSRKSPEIFGSFWRYDPHATPPPTVGGEPWRWNASRKPPQWGLPSPQQLAYERFVSAPHGQRGAGETAPISPPSAHYAEDVLMARLIRDGFSQEAHAITHGTPSGTEAANMLIALMEQHGYRDDVIASYEALIPGA